MRAAFLASAALIAAPLAQAQTATNDQFTLRGTSAEMEVVTESAMDVGASAVAGGNAYAIAGDGANSSLASSQHADGPVSADISASIGSAGRTAIITSAAVANGLTATTANSDMEVRAIQLSHADASATTLVDTGYVGSAASSSAASGNVVALAADNGDISADLTQESTGAVRASTEADHWGSDGQVSAGSIASANNITASGYTTTALLDTSQSAAGAAVIAETELYAGHAADASGNATANANALTIANAFGYVNTHATQQAAANVEARAYVTLGEDFAGFASAGAYGVGNSVTVANSASDTMLDVIQNNQGAISAEAGLIADGGEQALASAAAYGNVVSAGLCGQCGEGGSPTLSANNAQVNSGDVRARAAIDAPSATLVAGSATAIGNAATYQTLPGG